MSHITVTIPVTAETAELVKKLLGCVEVSSDAAPAAETKKPRSRKAKEVEETDSDDDMEEDTEDESDEDSDTDSDSDDSDDEDEAPEEDDEEVEDDDRVSPEQLVKIKKALRAYSSKHGKDKTVKTLQKFAKASQEVKAADFGKVIKALKV